MAINGRPAAIKYKGREETILFNQVWEIKSDDSITIMLLIKLTDRANKIQSFTILKLFIKLSFESSFETREVHARFKPEVARVIANMYTDIISPNTPIASVPILFEVYNPNAIPILLIAIFVTVSIEPLIKNFFVLFKISPV